MRRAGDIAEAGEKTRLLGEGATTTTTSGEDKKGDKKPSLTKVLLKVFGGPLFVSQVRTESVF